ncbi:aspartic peptidase domain-containing protein [Mycena capillaripes]|nr:aspartic peptidase domain-containing protein [Mycena capillaripes]
MQLPAPFLALLATVTLALFSVDARPVKGRRTTSGMITLPVRRIERDGNLHVELRHQQQVNRAERLMARAAGLPGPSDAQLQANLERRASFLDLAPPAKRFNIPSPDYILPSDGSGGIVSNVATQNDDTSDDPPKLAKNSSEILIDGPDTTYAVTVQLGTPPRDFAIILDSGSGDFWVESDECKGEDGGGCGNHAFLGESSSQTFVNTKKQWSVSYGSGAASGELVTDALVLGGMVLGNHSFGVAHSVSQEFFDDKVVDGLMGLGKKGLSNQGVPTPVQALKDAGFIDKAITSYRLPRFLDHTNNGEVSFGGLDDTKFDPKTLVTLDAAADTDGFDAFWFAKMDGVSVDGDDVQVAAQLALMDTGTSLMAVPTKDAAAIHAKIPGAKLKSSGQYSIPCNTTASLALKFGGKSFPINPKDLVFASNGATSGDCTSGISVFADTKFLVGDTFLKSVYFSTNVDDNTITLAVAV